MQYGRQQLLDDRADNLRRDRRQRFAPADDARPQS